MPILSKVLRAGEGKTLKQFQSIVAAVNDVEPQFEALSDQDLATKTTEFRSRIAAGESLDELQVEAFATVREAAKRVLGQRHFDVQIIGAAALHRGMVAEMKTGEGKTLVSTMPAYLNALNGKGVHLVTVNDYLASRDAEWMGAVHRFLGLNVGLIQNGMSSAERHPAYDSDITYGTNNEFGFDYLRDNMAMRCRRPGAARSSLRHRRRGRLDPHRRGAYAFDHLRPGRRQPPSGTGSSPGSPTGCEGTPLRGRRAKEAGPDHRGGRRHGSRQVLGIENLFDHAAVDFVHHLEAALRAKELYLPGRRLI